MTVKQLIKHLRYFDENHNVNIEVDTERGYLKVKTNIEDVQFKEGNCILYGQDY